MEVLINGVRYVATDDVPARAADIDTAAMQLVKAHDERRYALGLAYAARIAPGRGADGFNDWISEENLELACWQWTAKSREIGLFHKDGELYDNHGTVVESYIFRAPDWRVISPITGEEVVIKTGSWMLGVVFDEYGWGLVKAGLVNGWSPEGGAVRRKSSVAQLRS